MLSFILTAKAIQKSNQGKCYALRVIFGEEIIENKPHSLEMAEYCIKSAVLSMSWHMHMNSCRDSQTRTHIESYHTKKFSSKQNKSGSL